MPCFSPLDAYYAAKKNPSGKRGIVFDPRLSLSGAVLKLPCGRCIGCRLEKSRQWAVRLMHENKMHDVSCFLTLTYDDDNMPLGGSLSKRDLQLFMKRLRKKYSDRRIRFYACGEYGDQSQRPHYHLLLFNHWFEDAKLIRKGEHALYESKDCKELWPYGLNAFGEVNWQRCQYVARYILKKLNGPLAEDNLTCITQYGEVIVRQSQFTVMSRRPGIGAKWFDQYHDEVYAYDSVISNGHEAKPPRFYDIKYELLDSVGMERVRKDRRLKALAPNRRADNTKARLRVREVVELRKLKTFEKASI